MFEHAPGAKEQKAAVKVKIHSGKTAQEILNERSNDLTGNHRSSGFRKLIGQSLIKKEELKYSFWSDKSKKN